MTSIQKLAATHTKQSTDWVIKNIKAIPAEKLDWLPMGKARSVIDQTGELARFAAWVDDKISGRTSPFDSEDAVTAWKKDFTTIDSIISELEKNTVALCTTIENLPDSRLDDTVKFPWSEEGDKLTDVIFYHYWNNTYHQGQICYIQLMLGDTEFYM